MKKGRILIAHLPSGIVKVEVDTYPEKGMIFSGKCIESSCRYNPVGTICDNWSKDVFKPLNDGKGYFSVHYSTTQTAVVEGLSY